MPYEQHDQPIAHRMVFITRMMRSLLVAICFVAGALGIGMAGYHDLEGLSWIDAFLNASMILSGMGPVAPLATNAGKLFAGFYALFSGIIILAISGLLLAPLLHRILHDFHLEGRERKPTERPPGA